MPPGIYLTEWKGGMDGGRHGWFRWSDGPQPEGTKTTQSIAISDLVLLKVQNAAGTPDFVWEEPFPQEGQQDVEICMKFAFFLCVVQNFLHRKIKFC